MSSTVRQCIGLLLLGHCLPGERVQHSDTVYRLVIARTLRLHRRVVHAHILRYICVTDNEASVVKNDIHLVLMVTVTKATDVSVGLGGDSKL